MYTQNAAAHARKGTWVVKYKAQWSDTIIRVTIRRCSRQGAIKKSKSLLMGMDQAWTYVGARKAPKE